MVIVRLIGGLGNQMFQYACGRRLAHVLGVPLKLDLGGFSRDPLRRYGLHEFNIRAEVASPDETHNYADRNWLGRRIAARFGLGNLKVVRERGFSFDPEVLALKGNLYLDGYWQSEKYFKDIEVVIREELALTTVPNQANRALIDAMRGTDSVSLHVRRGDYVSSRTTNAVHGVCELSYFLDAVEFMASRVKSPSFFVFSDDPEWAASNIRLRFPATYITNNGLEQAQEDIRLMSYCRNNIIANSSFSWWGAWLNLNPEKIVIAPVRWFRDGNIDTSDVIPSDWIRL